MTILTAQKSKTMIILIAKIYQNNDYILIAKIEQNKPILTAKIE